MNASTWIGVVGGAIGVIAPLLFAWLNNATKLRYDAELVAVKQKLADCEQNHADCQENHNALAAEVKVLAAKVNGG